MSRRDRDVHLRAAPRARSLLREVRDLRRAPAALAALALVVVVAVVALPAPAADLYGKPLRGLSPVAVADVVKDPARYAAKAVRVEGANAGRPAAPR